MSFSTYDRLKDSEVEWVGVVPDHWVLQPLKRVATFNDDVLSEKTPGNYEIEYVEISDVDSQKGTIRASNFTFDSAPSRARRRAKSGDVLISTVRTYLRAIAPVIEAPDNLVVSTGFAVIRPKLQGLMSGYIGYLLRAEWFISKVIAGSVGVSYPAINASDLVNIGVPVPPESEQERIAAFLDHETAKIDALVEEQKRLIKLLKEKRQAVISQAVTKGLDPNVPMKDSGVEWLGEVPEHWSLKSYRHAAKIYRGKFGHRPRNDPQLYDGRHPFIQTGDIARADAYIEEYSQTLNDKGAAVSQAFPAGTLVMAIAANIGNTAILGFEAFAPDSVVGFTPKADLDLHFLRYNLDAALQEFEKTSTQSTQANLNIDRIGSVKAIFPPLAEQVAIVKHLDVALEAFAGLEKQAQDGIVLMTERRSALISAAVTGKIDVRNWQAPATPTTNDKSKPVRAAS